MPARVSAIARRRRSCTGCCCRLRGAMSLLRTRFLRDLSPAISRCLLRPPGTGMSQAVISRRRIGLRHVSTPGRSWRYWRSTRRRCACRAATATTATGYSRSSMQRRGRPGSSSSGVSWSGPISSGPARLRARWRGLAICDTRASAVTIGDSPSMGTVLPSEKGDRDQAMEEWAPRGESLERVPILVVEDDEDDALLVREMLGPNRFEMAHAQRLAEAKSHLANASPGCVLLDLTLPDAHELEGLIELRTHAPDVPIVILSGLAD